MFRLRPLIGGAVLALLVLMAGLLGRRPHAISSETVAPSHTQTTPQANLTFPPLALADKALRNSGIRVATAQAGVLHQVLRFPGQIAVDQHLQQAIAARFNGVVVQMPRHAGERVQQGDLLAVLESRELADLRLNARQQAQELAQAERLLSQANQIDSQVKRLIQLLRSGSDPTQIQSEAEQLALGAPKAELLQAYSQLRLRRDTLARTRQARQDQLASAQELAEAQQLAESAAANYSAALSEITRQHDNLRQERLLTAELARAAANNSREKLTALGARLDGPLTRYEIRAPRSGTLIEKRVGEGESVSAESTLYLLADLSHVWAEMAIYASDLQKVKVGMPVQIVSEDGQIRSTGRLNHLKPVVDPVSRTAEAHAEIPNPKGQWFPGMYVNLDLVQQKTQAPVVIARSALQSLQQQNVVFVQTPAGFVVRAVRTGAQDSHQVVIVSGLKAGERYVANNSFVLKSELLSQTEE